MPENIIDRKLRVRYDPALALTICEMIADGLTLVEIAKEPGMPNRSTIHKWLAVYPKFFDAYERAREISAQSFEEEALLMARTLKDTNDFTGTKVQAYNIAMQQLRWSASRRDKARYGQQASSVPVVPIQINTTLNLGQDGMGTPSDSATSIYTLEAQAVIPAFTEGYDEDTVDRLVTEAATIEELSPNGDEDEASAWGVPSEESQQLHNPPNGRPPTVRRKKGHKSPSGTARTARIYSEQQRNAIDRAKAKIEKESN